MLPCLITRETKTVRICTCELVLCTMPFFLTANMRPSMMPFLMEIAISTKRQFERGREKSIKNNQRIYLKIRNHSACEEETTRKMGK